MVTAYVDRTGNKISKADWRRLRNNESYSSLRKYENQKIKVEVKWLGSIVNSNNIPFDYWKPFGIEVYNIVDKITTVGIEKNYALDPLLTKTYSTEESAIHDFYGILEKYTNCYWEEVHDMYNEDNGKMKFIMIDNIHESEMIDQANELSDLESQGSKIEPHNDDYGSR